MAIMTTDVAETRERRVSFPKEDDKLETNHLCVPLLSELTEEHRRETWFKQEDFCRFKQMAQIIARESRKFGYGDLLAEQDEEESLTALKRWAKVSSVRGTERWCNIEEGKKRKKRQRDCILNVLKTQHEIREVGNKYLDRKIAEVSQRYSKSARQFAVKMGIADALATSPLPNGYMNEMGFSMTQASVENRKALESAPIDSLQQQLCPCLR